MKMGGGLNDAFLTHGGAVVLDIIAGSVMLPFIFPSLSLPFQEIHWASSTQPQRRSSTAKALMSSLWDVVF